MDLNPAQLDNLHEGYKALTKGADSGSDGHERYEG